MGRPPTDERTLEALLRGLYLHSPVAIGFFRDGVTLGVNPAHLRLLGYASEQELVGKSVLEQIAPAARPEIRRRIEARRRGEPLPGQVESIVLHKDGTELPCMVHIARLELPDGPTTATFVQDISDRKSMERSVQLHRAMETLHNDVASAFANATSDRIDAELALALEKMARCAGATRGALLRFSDELRTLSTTHEWCSNPAAGPFLPPATIPGEATPTSDQGSGPSLFVPLVRQGRLTGALAFSGDPGHALSWPPDFVTLLATMGGLIQNLLERQRAEREKEALQAQLLHAQKMEAVGQLAGGIAHDFNNILAAMTLQLSLLQTQPGLPRAQLHDALGDLLASANRAANLTRQLLLFSRKQTLKSSRHELNEVLRNLGKLLRRVIDERVALSMELSDQPLWVDGDVGMFEQVVTNLCVNARDAMPRGGSLTLRTTEVFLDADEVGGCASGRTGRFAVVQVSDTGCGMAPEVLERLFEPFFTTKPPGKGTGLGLATAHGIVAQHGGFIQVRSRVGEGSTFEVHLPTAPAEGARAAGDDATPLARGHERILVVEDELLVRNMAARCLRSLDYEVVEAENGADALRIWEREAGRFDLLFTDMIMPGGISGLELCRRLRELDPGLVTGLASGYGVETLDQENLAQHRVTFLAKPYDISTLAATVRGWLDRRR